MNDCFLALEPRIPFLPILLFIHFPLSLSGLQNSLVYYLDVYHTQFLKVSPAIGTSLHFLILPLAKLANLILRDRGHN